MWQETEIKLKFKFRHKVTGTRKDIGVGESFQRFPFAGTVLKALVAAGVVDKGYIYIKGTRSLSGISVGAP